MTIARLALFATLLILIPAASISVGESKDKPGSRDVGKPKVDLGLETATHQEIEPLAVEFKTLTCLRLCPNGRLLAGDGGTKQIKVIDGCDRQVDAVSLEFAPEAIDVAPDGTIYCGPMNLCMGPGEVAYTSESGLGCVKAYSTSDEYLDLIGYVAGYAQRKYDALAAFLEEQLSRPVGIIYAESLILPRVRQADGIDLVIGKFSEVVADARRTELPVRPIAMLSGDDGFVGLSAVGESDSQPGASWTDWRGPNRDAICDELPGTLPAEKRLLWSHTCTGPGMSGMALAGGRLIVTDKSLDTKNDVFRCLDAHTGRQIWSFTYSAPGEMDFTNSPRANPVIRDGLVYVLGAFGHLHCLKLDTGRVVWKKNLIADFGAELPMWGYSSTPLPIGDKLIVNPGAKDASLAALDRKTGDVLWSTPGEPPGYASFILATFGGVRQIVGYDSISLGGWDPNTGRRLWKLVPELDGDFNVPTPIVVDGQLLVSTENNGTRLYEFDESGRIKPEPVALNEDLIPDTSHAGGNRRSGVWEFLGGDLPRSQRRSQDALATGRRPMGRLLFVHSRQRPGLGDHADRRGVVDRGGPRSVQAGLEPEPL